MHAELKSIIRRVLGVVPAGHSFLIDRHSATVRVSHWINAVCLLFLLMSGLQIFNAHPALYWGKSSDFDHPILSLTARNGPQGLVGVTQIGSRQFDTTGILGASDEDGVRMARGFPAWATLPGPQWLAMGRLWHFAFAWLFAINGVLFWIYAFARGHAGRDLMPTGGDIRHLGREILDHLRLKFPKGEAARRYNALQKLAYVAVIFGLGPLVVLTGLTMSPTMDSAFPALLWIFAGRQSARTIHFICAFSFLGFFVVHIVMVMLSGTWNNLRSMITGRYAIEDHDG
ncbi:MAG: cytochrome b/b6 domain-containing protein [Alphaproteobacteria bacterium]|nr:cytochrome b/b6 domain-containing protein [Alphaproteobacteria bacterium]